MRVLLPAVHRAFAVDDNSVASVVADVFNIDAVLHVAANLDIPSGELLHDDIHHGAAAVMADHARVVDQKDLLHDGRP